VGESLALLGEFDVELLGQWFDASKAVIKKRILASCQQTLFESSSRRAIASTGPFRFLPLHPAIRSFGVFQSEALMRTGVRVIWAIENSTE
jgi:hypothetical protein